MNDVTFGIDLGTTNSCISMLQSNTSVPKIIPLKDGNTLQSCVMLNEDGTFTVGKEAYEHRYEDSAIYSVKRFMGTDKDILLQAGDKKVLLKPEEVSAKILREIVDQAEKYVGKGIIKDVTITVPAHFNDMQRRATQKAGELAGLNVINIINEPTSAGLLYGLDNAKSNETILVYDLGGGTFDVSILRVVKNLRKFPLLGINTNGEYDDTSISIVANDGDVHLGGDDIDEKMLHYVTNRMSDFYGVSGEYIEENLMTKREIEMLKLIIEQFKKSGLKTFYYSICDRENVDVKFDGKEYEEFCFREVFNKTFEYVSRAMASAGVSMIDHIVLVGGSTKSPVIRKMLKEKFPNIDIMSSFEPDLSVALGASISSASALGVSKIATITDVVPLSIGVVVMDENGNKKFSKILKKDTQLPCRAIQTYTAKGDEDASDNVTVRIYQGESINDISKLYNIGTVSVECHSSNVSIEFVCDLNGVLSCFVHSDGNVEKIDINYSINNMKKNQSKDLTEGLDILDKGQVFFYNKHLKKLRDAGVPDNLIQEKFNPYIIIQDMEVAKKNYNDLLTATS